MIQAWGWLGLLVLMVAADEGQGEVAQVPISYQGAIRPLLQRHCQGCHQPSKKAGGLAVTSHAALVVGGKAGPSIVAGKPEESPLYLSLVGEEDFRLMPEKADPLPAAEIDLVRQWIAQGATDDSTTSATTDDISPDRPPVYRGKPLITALAWSPDGKSIAVGGYREILLHEPDGSAIQARLVGMSQRIQALAYSPDGSRLAAVGGSPGRFGEVQIWDPANKKLLVSANFTEDTLFGAAWSSDGKWLAFGCADNSARVIEVETGEQILKVDHHTDFVLGAVFSVDNKHMVTVSRDRAVKLTETESGAFIDNITSITPGALTGGLEAIDRHPKENQVAVGGIDGVPKLYQIFRTRARQIGDDFNLIRPYEAVPGKISALDISPDGKLLAVAGTGETRVYELESGTRVATVPFEGSVYTAVFDPASERVASGGYSGILKIFEARTGKVLHELIPVPLESSVAQTAGSKQ